MGTCYVWEEAYDRKLHAGSYEACKEYIRERIASGDSIEAFHIVSNETGRCLSFVL
jgi:hypothetical protein